MVDIKPDGHPNSVVRHELGGDIIWSYNLNHYVRTRDKETQALLSQYFWVRRQKSQIGQFNFPDSFLSDMEIIGVNGDCRHITNPTQPAPFDTYFDYTYKCNQQCVYCYNKYILNKNITLSTNRIRRVIYQLWLNGVMRLHLAGGEPLFSPRHLEIYLKTASELKMCVSINTNGTLLTKEIGRKIIKYTVKSLTISLDSHNPMVHDSFRVNGAGSFDKTVKGIKSMVGIKQQYQSPMNLKIKMIWNSRTPLSAFEDIIHFCQELGLDEIKFSCPQRYLDGMSEKYFHEDYISSYYERIHYINELHEKYKSGINIVNVCNPCGNPIIIGLHDNFGCIGGQELIAITPSGTLQPCSMNFHNLGNLFTDYHGNFFEYLQSEARMKYISQTKEQISIECDTCNYWPYCRGGSYIRLQKSKNDPLCPISSGYLKKNDKISKAPSYQINQDLGLQHFEPIYVAHSL